MWHDLFGRRKISASDLCDLVQTWPCSFLSNTLVTMSRLSFTNLGLPLSNSRLEKSVHIHVNHTSLLLIYWWSKNYLFLQNYLILYMSSLNHDKKCKYASEPLWASPEKWQEMQACFWISLSQPWRMTRNASMLLKSHINNFVWRILVMQICIFYAFLLLCSYCNSVALSHIVMDNTTSHCWICIVAILCRYVRTVHSKSNVVLVYCISF